MKKKINIIVVVILSFFLIKTIKSQIIYSPYSLFGVGQIEENGFGTSKALGGTGIAFQSINSLNNINPASYSSIDSLNFLFEIGLSFHQKNYTTANESINRFDGNIQYLAIGMRLSRFWGMSIGLTPISNVGYIINSTGQIQGEATFFNKTYTGNGGINKFYIGNSFKINKNLSLGVNVSGIFGTITQTETAEAFSEFTGYSVEKIRSVQSFYLDYGIQYTFKIKNNKYSIGFIYGGKKDLITTSDINIDYQDNNIEISEEDVDKFKLPKKIGIGIAINKNDLWRAGLDYERKSWGEINFSNDLL